MRRKGRETKKSEREGKGWRNGRKKNRTPVDGERIIIIGSVNFVATRRTLAMRVRARARTSPEFFDISRWRVLCFSRNRDLPIPFSWCTMYHIIRESDQWWDPSLSPQPLWSFSFSLLRVLAGSLSSTSQIIQGLPWFPSKWQRFKIKEIFRQWYIN